jgi:hypothetical protein
MIIDQLALQGFYKLKEEMGSEFIRNVHVLDENYIG